MSGALSRLAESAGLCAEWQDVSDTNHRIEPRTLRAVLKALGLPADDEASCRESQAVLDAETAAPKPLTTAETGQSFELAGKPGPYRLTLEDGTVAEGSAEPAADGFVRLAGIDQPGYHRLEIGDAAVTVAVAPSRAVTVQDVAQGRRLWGLAVQVYGLRRAGDAGIGDFASLAQFAASAARHGADAVTVSPVHALFSADLSRYGPYAPSSRIALNALYAPVDAAHPASAEPDALIDWKPAAQARLAVLRASFDRDDDQEEFARFRKTVPLGLERHAIFEVIAMQQAARGGTLDWRQWPQALRNPQNPAVAELARGEAREVNFHLYLQYRAGRGLAEAQRAAKDAGMKIGLIADLAVGADSAGSDAWGRPDEVLHNLAIGAPPDEFNRSGQDWGVTAFSPRGLRNSGYGVFLDMLRSALSVAGGLRIDHAMGLARLWVVPHGASPKDGVYLGFPMQDLLRLVALESHRHQAVIIGEDLGTVPRGFRGHLAERGIDGMSVLWFERDGDRFIPPWHWRSNTVAMTTTHDLPTVAGWWQGRDIEWRERLNIEGENRDKRDADRGALWSALRCSGTASGEMPAAGDSAPVVNAAAAHLGTAASPLAILPAEDALALAEQPNLPGTTDEHPNWRRRLPGDAATMLDAPDVAARLARLNYKRNNL